MKATSYWIASIVAMLILTGVTANAQSTTDPRHKEYIARLIFEDVKPFCTPPLGDLVGPMQLIEGEVVSCADQYGLPVFSVADPEKWLPKEIVKPISFFYKSGNPLDFVHLIIPQTGEVVRMSQPINPNNVPNPIIRLAPLKTLIGAPKSIVSNRLIPPSDRQKSGDEEIWSYKNEVVETRIETKMITSQIDGTFADESFSASERRFIPVHLKRNVTRWDFQIVIGPDGRVKNFTAKQPISTAWTPR